MSVATLGLLVSLLLPLLALVLLPFARWRPLGLRLAPWAALPALGLALLLPAAELELPWLLLGAHFGLDSTGRLFLGFSAGLWLAAGLYSVGYITEQAARWRFFIWFLLSLSGNLVLILSRDVPTFYFGFALMSFSAYGLVVHDRSQEAMRAGRIYMLLVVVGEVSLFAALVMAVSTDAGFSFKDARTNITASAYRDWIVALLLLGFGIKAGLVGLHVWLPLAHPVAPTPASAVLSGAMIKAGLLGWLRLLPLGELPLPQWAELLMIVGLVSIFYGAVIGVTQQRPKTVLAYSSISQMGVISLGVGAGLATPQAWPLLSAVVATYALHHGLAKGALFLGVGMVSHSDASARALWWLRAGLLLPALALAGAPLTSGMLAKSWLKTELAALEGPWQEWLLTLLPWSSVATTLLMARFLFLVWPSRAGGAASHPPGPKSGNGAVGLWFAWGLLCSATLVAAWLLPRPHLAGLWSAKMLYTSTWPLLLGTLVAGVTYLVGHRVALSRRWNIPSGDVLVALEWLLQKIPWPGASHKEHKPESAAVMQGRSLPAPLAAAEQWLGRWQVTASLFLLLMLGLFWLPFL